MSEDATPAHPMDPLRDWREGGGIWMAQVGEERIPMILGYRALRQAARDWQTFSNDAPGRVPIPAETDVRSLRQLPIETDPPDHTDYKEIVKPWFRRPTDPAYLARLAAITDGLIDKGSEGVEAVSHFALPLQSRALALLLNMPEDEAEVWVSWGIHAFKVAGRNMPEMAQRLERYIAAQFDRAEAAPGDDIFSDLGRATFRGRPLTRAEKAGFIHVTFAGGRDTVIHSVTGTLAHLARHPEDLERLRAEPALVATAAEELFRVLSPLTHIGRVCPRGARIGGVEVAPGGRIALGFAAANYDPAIFEAPCELRIGRNPNPHVAFGSGDHACLGATHARAVIRVLLQRLAARVARIELHEAEGGTKDLGGIARPQGFRRLDLALVPR